MRTNLYREKIVNVLRQNHLLSINEIHKKIPRANFSTIFRNIEQLYEDKSVKRIIVDKDTILYELSDHRHDHFVCDDCGDIQQVHFSRKIKMNQVVIADIMIRGTCEDCK